MQTSSRKIRILAFALALLLLIPASFLTGCHSEEDDGKDRGESESNALPPTDLKVNLLEEAFGVDRTHLAFSWVMNDKAANEKQTARRIVIAEGMDKFNAGNYVIDTGWVDSSENTAVTPDGTDRLGDNTLYYWAVATANTKGEKSAFSEPQAFSTDVGSKWADTRGIWNAAPGVQPGRKTSTDWSDYTVEIDFKITSVALGIIFRGEARNFYMWQFKVDGGKAMLYPHVYQNGSFVGGKAIDSVEVPAECAFNVGSEIKAIIEIEGNTATTYLKKGNDLYEIDSRDLSDYGFAEGVIGFRTGGSESGTVTRIEAYNDEGILYSSDFSASNPFSKCSVTGGTLTVPKALSVGCLLDKGSVTASVEADEYGKATSRFSFLRHEFTLTDEEYQKLDRAILTVTATSTEATRQYVSNLYINGESIGVGPSRDSTDVQGKPVLFTNAFDVTSALKAGANCLGAINYATDGRLFLCQMTVYAKDGTSKILVNSARDAQKWQAHDGDKAFGIDNSIGTKYYTAHANNIDANCYPFGFSKAGFKATGWSAPAVCQKIDEKVKLTPAESDPVRRYVYPTDSVRVSKTDSDTVLVDLGAEIIGSFGLSLDLPAPATLTLVYGEQVKDGHVVSPMLTGNEYKETWTLTAGKNVIDTIDLFAYRYVEISGCPVAIEAKNVRATEVRTAFSEEESSFSSDNSLLNALFALTKNTIKRTTQDVYVDSQTRERLPYEGDLIINLLAAYAFEDDYSIGRFSTAYLATHRTWPAEYPLYEVISAKADAMETGDLSFISEYYEILKAKIPTDKLNEDWGLVDIGNLPTSTQDGILIDWPLGERDKYDASVKFNTVYNSVFVRACEDLSDVARMLGKESDAKTYADLAAQIRDSMIDFLYDPETGAFSDGLTAEGEPSAHTSQHATAFALAANITDGAPMADKMAGFIRSQGEIRMSVYGTFFLLEGLYASGHGDIANQLLLGDKTGEGVRTYANMLALGATLTAEAFSPKNKDNMTFSHPWGAAPACAIVNGIFGIEPTSAGYGTFDIRLQPGDLKTVSLRKPTVKGAIEVSFTRTAQNMTVTCAIPCNTEATLRLPGNAGQTVNVDGAAVNASCVDGWFTVTLGSGTHEISVQ